MGRCQPDMWSRLKCVLHTLLLKLLHAADVTYKYKLDFSPVIQVLANADIFLPMLVE